MALKKKQLALLAALAAQQIGGVASAQSQAPDQALAEITVQATREAVATYNEPVAISGTRIAASLRDVPQTINVVPQQLLRDQGARSMEQVLKSVPGVGLSHGDGQRDQVTIRGFSAIADQFIDGIRDDALYFRDLSNIEQVEVVKGPASVLYGRGSSGGLVNRISKKPGIDKTEATLQVGRWAQRRAEIDVARAGDSGVAFRVTGAVERADSYRSQQFLDREALAPSLSWKLSGATSLLLQAEYLSDRRVTDFGVPSYRGRPVDVPASAYYGAANAGDVDTSEAEVRAIGFTLNHRLSDSVSLRNALRRYDYTLVRNNTLVGGVNESALTASLNRTNLRREEDGYFNQTEVVHKTRLFGAGHQFLYGAEFGKQEKDQLNRSQSAIRTVALFAPVLPVLPQALTVAPSTDNTGIMTTAGVYLQDMVTLTPEWKALAGLRHDRFKQETRERRAGQPNLARTDSVWSPRVGVVYQPGTDHSYYASFSKSFQPSAENFALAANNAQIAPEQTTNREVGAKLDFLDGALSATASLFRLGRTNVKATDPATNRLMPIGTQRTDGVELTLAGELPHGWQVWSGYAYLDARTVSSPAIDNSDNVLRNVPVQGKRATLTARHSANLWLTRSFATHYRAGAGVSHVGDRFANPGNTVLLPAYTTADAMIGYRSGALDLQLNITNLFDRKYFVSGHGSAPNLNLPGAPRAVQLTVRYAL